MAPLANRTESTRSVVLVLVLTAGSALRRTDEASPALGT
jgi:hypothetical protein